MGIRVKVDFSGIEKKLERSNDKTKYYLANQVLADSNLYAPRLSGDLRRFSRVSNHNDRVVWEQPYARKQYYTQFSNYTEGGTGPKWVERAKRYHIADWVKIVEGGYK